MSIDIAAGGSRTIVSGDTLVGSAVNVGGELNIDGELRASTNAGLSASAVGEAFGTGDLNRSRTMAAVGVAQGRGIALETILSGESRTAQAGVTDRAGGIDVGGELNTAGQINVGGDAGTLDRTLFAAAAGTGSAAGTGTLLRSRTMAAAGFGDGFGAGDLTFSGRLSAIGTGSGVGRQILTVVAGDVVSITAGTEQRQSGVDVDGELNVGGELSVSERKGRLSVERGLFASGIGEAVGASDLRRFRNIAAAGSGDAIGTAAIVESIPLIRGDTLTADFAEDESVTLNAEQD